MASAKYWALWPIPLSPPLLQCSHSARQFLHLKWILVCLTGKFQDAGALRCAAVLSTRVPRASAGPRERFACSTVVKSCSLLSSSLARCLLFPPSLLAFPFCVTIIRINDAVGEGDYSPQYITYSNKNCISTESWCNCVIYYVFLTSILICTMILTVLKCMC